MNTYNEEASSIERDSDNNNDPNQKVPADHPGLQKIIKNDNPRANENITTETSGSDAGKDDEVDSEITDGEDG